jgi:hypothetical protein
VLSLSGGMLQYSSIFSPVSSKSLTLDTVLHMLLMPVLLSPIFKRRKHNNEEENRIITGTRTSKHHHHLVLSENDKLFKLRKVRQML